MRMRQIHIFILCGLVGGVFPLDSTVDLGFNQSTDSHGLIYSSETSDNLVDGKFTPSFINKYCFHTDANKPWWIVYFDKAYFVREIRVLGSGNPGMYFQKTTIRTSLDTSISPYLFESFRVFTNYRGTLLPHRSKAFRSTGPSPYARSVLLHTDQGLKLSLCEIEISSLRNLAIGKPSSLNSVLFTSRGFWATDGFTSDQYNVAGLFCAHSAGPFSTYDWWKVDLLEQNAVYAVSIIGRKNFNENNKKIRIAVGDNDTIPSFNSHRTCAINHETSGSTLTKRCKRGSYGQYLSVQQLRLDVFIIICEISIYGIELSRNLDFRFIITNNITYEDLTVTYKGQCNTNFNRYTTDISLYNLKNFKLFVKGIGIVNYCRNFKLLPSVAQRNSMKNYNECHPQKYLDGYMNERDMNDECEYECKCDKCDIFNFDVFFNNIKFNFREIYVIMIN